MSFLRFCLVGTVGFVADAGMTVALTNGLNFSPLPGRILAFVFAATITWQLNRVFTFRTLAGIRSLLSYITLTSAGAFINIGVYSIWIRAMGIDPVQVTFGVGIGSAVALVFNYGISRYIVFRKQMPSDPR